MHFEILMEDASGEILVREMIVKLLGPQGAPHTYKVRGYKGLGGLPRNPTARGDGKRQALLNNLPALLRAYGKQHQHMEAAVVVVMDLDARDCKRLEQELQGLVDQCDPSPVTLFRFAIEELEAWLLGDQKALLAAFPHARKQVLKKYRQDAVCGTWELLADAIHPGGSKALKQQPWPKPGETKCDWARTVAPLMDPDANNSPSFQSFRDGVRQLAGQPPRLPDTCPS